MNKNEEDPGYQAAAYLRMLGAFDGGQSTEDMAELINAGKFEEELKVIDNDVEDLGVGHVHFDNLDGAMN